jgi:phosphoserine phosphatase
LNVISPEAPALARALRAFGTADWLCPDYAFDLPLAANPDAALAQAQDAANGMAADINVLPAADRRKKLLAADMESTIISCECVDELAEIAGIRPQIAAITERVMRGEIEFAGALRERVALLKGLPLSALERVYSERVRFNPGAPELVATMRANGAVTMLLSGGFTYFAQRVARAAGFDLERANTLLDDGARLLGTVEEPIFGREGKLQAIREIMTSRKIDVAQTLAVGDGANDVDMVSHAGLGVAWHAKPVLWAVTPVRITHADLKALLYLQGYRESEIVRPSTN